MDKQLMKFQNFFAILFRLARKGVNSCLLILNTSAGNMTLMLFIRFWFCGPALESGCIVQSWITLWETRGYHRIATEDSIHIRYPAMLSDKQLPTFWIIIIMIFRIKQHKANDYNRLCEIWGSNGSETSRLHSTTHGILAIRVIASKTQSNCQILLHLTNIFYLLSKNSLGI